MVPKWNSTKGKIKLSYFKLIINWQKQSSCFWHYEKVKKVRKNTTSLSLLTAIMAPLKLEYFWTILSMAMVAASWGVLPDLIISTARKLGRNLSITSPSPVAAAAPAFENRQRAFYYIFFYLGRSLFKILGSALSTFQ